MIQSKLYFYIQMELLSPLSIGGGEDFLTDHDCLKDSQGNPFIPATSLAGVFYHYLSDAQRNLFTPKAKDEYKQSPYFISEATLALGSSANTSIRDGVRLDENKTAEKGAKFDFEVVEPGTKFDFRMEITVRDHDDEKEMQKVVDVILNGLDKGEILLGFKSKRGYGKVKILETKMRRFEKGQMEALLSFNRYNKEEYENYQIEAIEAEARFDNIQVNLEQLGGISIRRYSAKAGNVDFEHITSNGKPVIPGTSWNGLIRRQLSEYLNTDTLFSSGVILTDWFGREKRKDLAAQASNIMIEESVIEEAKEMELTRNKIDRFSGGAADRALFSERAYFNGKTVLGIKVKKQTSEDLDNSRIIGLLALVIKDIDNGLLALGGQTSIGRGLFRVTKVTKNGEPLDLDEAIGKILGGATNE